MKALIISDVTIHGGVDPYIEQLVEVSYQEGLEIFVALNSSENTDRIFNSLNNIPNVICKRYKLSKNYSCMEISEGLERIISSFTPDIVHVICGAIHSALYIREYFVSKNIPLFFTESVIDEEYVFENDIKKRIYALYEKAAGIFTVSKNNKDVITKVFDFPTEKIVDIKNGIDITKIGKRKNRFDGKFKFVTVARLSKQKGLDVLLESIKELLQRKVEKFHLTIYGDGEEEEYLKQKTIELNIVEYVTFAGWIDDVNESLQKYDAFVLPSRYEGMPIALLEAMAAKLPCIATDVSGNTELLEYGKFGMLVHKESINDLTEAMYKMIYDYKYYLSIAEDAFVHVCKNHNYKINMKIIVDLWKKEVKNL
jgi:Glycosyltransferase